MPKINIDFNICGDECWDVSVDKKGNLVCNECGTILEYSEKKNKPKKFKNNEE